MPRESTLTQIQKESIEVEKFIFHIIIVDDAEPTYLDQVELTDAQKNFFKQRIAEVAEGTQYVFRDRDHNTLAQLCLTLDQDMSSFINNSKTICSDFKGHHRGGMTTDGAFIITTFKMLGSDQNNITLIALIKMDQKKVLEYQLEQTDAGRSAKMREIADSFIESKDAVQKVAIIDIGDYFSWDILAKERKKTEGIAEYFRNFLHANIKDTSSSLTNKAVNEVSKWSKLNVAALKDIPEISSRTSDPASYFKNRAVIYMQANEGLLFNSDNYIAHLFALDLDEISSETQAVIEDLSINMKEHLAIVGLDGQEFNPKPNSITKKNVRSKKCTEEGVIIEWHGNADDRGIKINPLVNHQTQIIITTSNLVDMD